MTTESGEKNRPMSKSAQSGGEGIFAPVIGHAGAKAILRSGLRRGDVHLMLTGPPASGKSVALLAIEEAIDGAEYVDSAGFSERQLRDTLAENPPALLLDEFDNMKKDAFKALNTALEQGRVTKQVTGDSYDVEIDTQVFVACNWPERLEADVKDRFVSVEFEPYTRDEFIDVCEILLPQQVGWVSEADNPGEIGRYIGEVVWDKTDDHSPRTARDAARLAYSAERVPSIVRAMQDSKADVESEPVFVEDLPHHSGDKNATKTGGDIKTLDDINSDMVTPEEVGQRSGEEVEAIIAEVKGETTDTDDNTSEETTQEAATTQSTQSVETPSAGDSTDSGGMEDRTKWRDGYTDAEAQQARQWIDQMRDAGNPISSNSARGNTFEILVPRDRKDEVLQLIRENQIAPQAPTIISNEPLFHDQAGDFSYGLVSFQFDYKDRSAMGSSGYDLQSIVTGLEQSDIKVAYTANGVLDDIPEL